MTHTERLPEGWATTNLGEIRVDHSKSIDPRKEPNQIFELYSIPSFADGHPEITKGGNIGSTKKTLVPGTVVVSKINPRINRVWVVGNYTKHQKIGSGEWIPFFPVDGIQPEYLAYYLRRNDFRDYLATRVSGVGGSLMRVKASTLADYPLVLPSPQHQHRIVEAIESYLTRLNAAVALLERVQQNLKRYRASVLKAAVEGRLVPTETELARKEGRDYEPASELLKRILVERRKKWIENAAEKARAKAEKKAREAGKPWTHADDIKTLEKERTKAAKKYKEPAAPDLSALRAQAGTSNLPDLPEGWCWAGIEQLAQHRLGKMLDKAKNDGKFRNYLRNANVQWFHFDMADFAQMRVTDDEFSNVSVVAGDLVVCEGGEPGRCSVWEGQEPIAIQKALHRVRTHPDVEPWFLAYHLGADALSHRLDQEFTGTTIKHFTGEAFRAHAFAVPPTGEQQRIIGAVRTALSLVEHISSQVERAIMRSTRLRQSILKWAFEGKLVEQDPNDLPAPRPGKHFVYALECDDGSIYIGQTHDILERWRQHASGKGAEWTKRHVPKKLVFWEEFDTLDAAVKREKELKTGFGRKWLRREIAAGRTRQASQPPSFSNESRRSENPCSHARDVVPAGRRRMNRPNTQNNLISSEEAPNDR